MRPTNQLPFSPGEHRQGRSRRSSGPECLRSSNPSRFASTAMSTRAPGDASRITDHGVSNSNRPRRPTANPTSNAYVTAAADASTRCLVFRPRPRRWPDCVQDDAALRTTLSSVASFKRSPRGFAKAVLHGLSPELVAEGRGNHCSSRRTQQGVADEGEKQGQQGTARRVVPPEGPERTEEKQPSIQSVELGQPLKRELASCCRSLTETVVVRDGMYVVLAACLIRDRIKELRQLVEHNRAAGVGAPLAGAEAPERGLARWQTGDLGLEVQVGYCAHGEGR